MAEREETLTAPSRAELVDVLHRHRWLKPVTKPREVPGGGEWFVRVRATDRPLKSAPPPAPPRGRRRPAVVAGIVTGILVALAAAGAAGWWLLDQLAAHAALAVGVLVVVALAYAVVKRR